MYAAPAVGRVDHLRAGEQAETWWQRKEELAALRGTCPEYYFIDANVQLFVTPSSTKQVKEAIMSRAVGKLTMESPKHRGIIYDPALHGETVTYPNVRIPPVNVACLKAWATSKPNL